MPGMFSIIFSAGLGFVLAYFGAHALVQQRFTLTFFQRGWLGIAYQPRPFYTLRGPRAILFGLICILGAAVIMMPWALALAGVNSTTPADDVVIFAALAGLALSVIGYWLALFFEFLHWLRQRHVKRK